MKIAWSSPGIARIAELIRTRTGLVFSEARRGEVEGTIRRAMMRRNVDSADRFIELLAVQTEARESLIAELTIGETYFRRDGAQFELLQHQVLPRLLRDVGPDRRVRAWSAGCASGEEPYSIAMLFDELDALGRAEITGTDISRPRLEDAQRGLYSRWSLRGMPDELVERYFSARGRYFELSPRLRSPVEFRYLNLAEDSFPSLSTGIWGMDLILCRNVLIYFDRDTVQHVAQRLLDSLSEHGWLLLGASDPHLAEIVDCGVVLTSAGLAYRRPGAAGPRDLRSRGTHEMVVRAAETGLTTYPASEPGRTDAEANAPEDPAGDVGGAVATDWLADEDTVTRPSTAASQEAATDRPVAAGAGVAPTIRDAADTEEALLDAWQARDFDAVVEHARRRAARSRMSEQAWVAWLRALANQGCLGEAGEIAARALEQHPTSAELLYVDSVLQLHAGRPRQAVAAARRALYLDRTLVVAHLALADAHQRLGDLNAARRSLRNAAVQLEGFARDTIVPASDGETAGRLAELVRVQTRLLDQSQRQEA